MRKYRGPARPEAEVAVVFSDIRPSDLWYAGFGEFSERSEDLSVVMTVMDGVTLKRQLGHDVVVVVPGEHVVTLHVDDSRQGTAGIDFKISGDQALKIKTEPGGYYYLSAAPDPDKKTWEPMVTEVTGLAQSGKIDGIRSTAGY